MYVLRASMTALWAAYNEGRWVCGRRERRRISKRPEAQSGTSTISEALSSPLLLLEICVVAYEASPLVLLFS